MTRFKLFLSITLSAAILASAHSVSAANSSLEPDDAPDIVNDLKSKENVVLSQPEKLNDRLVFDSISAKDTQKNAARQTTASKSGYRVEVFADNNPRTAKSTASVKKRNLEARFKQYQVYLVFESPYWRVRLGDFKSRAEAEGALHEVKAAFPSYANDLRIVRSTIKN